MGDEASYTRAMAPRRGPRLPDGVDAARIPPGQVLAAPGKWPVFTAGSVAEVDLGSWDLTVFGQVEHELCFTYAELRALPATEVVADIHCVTGWSRLGDRWTGVPVRALLASAGPLPGARFAVAHCEQGYTTGLPLEALQDDEALLCYGWNGEDLTPEHGWPLRLFVPSRYFWKSAKWVRALELTTGSRLGFWERRGYHDGADPWKEERYW